MNIVSPLPFVEFANELVAAVQRMEPALGLVLAVVKQEPEWEQALDELAKHPEFAHFLNALSRDSRDLSLVERVVLRMEQKTGLDLIQDGLVHAISISQLPGDTPISQVVPYLKKRVAEHIYSFEGKRLLSPEGTQLGRPDGGRPGGSKEGWRNKKDFDTEIKVAFDTILAKKLRLTQETVAEELYRRGYLTSRRGATGADIVRQFRRDRKYFGYNTFEDLKKAFLD